MGIGAAVKGKAPAISDPKVLAEKALAAASDKLGPSAHAIINGYVRSNKLTVPLEVQEAATKLVDQDPARKKQADAGDLVVAARVAAIDGDIPKVKSLIAQAKAAGASKDQIAIAKDFLRQAQQVAAMKKGGK